MSRYAIILVLVTLASPGAAATPFQVHPLHEEYRLDGSEQQITVGVMIRMPQDHYLFADKTNFTIEAMEGVEVGPLEHPEPITKFDSFLKKEVAIFPGKWEEVTLTRTISLPKTASSKGLSYFLKARVNYQGCSPKVCFLPASRQWPIKVIVQPIGSSTTDTSGSVATESKWNFSHIAQRGWLWALLLAFIGGLASCLLPCVYPMIPITIAVIGAKQTTSKLVSLQLGLLFAAGLALTYAVLGLVAASSGALLGSALQSPWVLLLVAAIFIAMGMSMCGLFAFRLPYFINQWASRLDNKQGHAGVLATGAITGVVAAPCVGPVILGVLTFVAKEQNLLLGFFMLFFFALGLSLPFVLLGIFSSMLTQLPKSGLWMERVKQLFGFVLIGMGIYFLVPVLPSWAFHLMVVIVLVGLAVLIRLRRFFGRLASTLLFAVLLIVAGALFFGSLLPRLTAPYEETAATKSTIAWQPELDTALDQARTANKPVIVDLFAEWCVACKELDRYTFSDSRVAELAKQFVAVKLDFTELDADNDRIMQRYNVLALPAILFFNRKGEYLASERINGFVDAEAMVQKLQQVLKR